LILDSTAAGCSSMHSTRNLECSLVNSLHVTLLACCIW
jgi:hypothetical protein